MKPTDLFDPPPPHVDTDTSRAAALRQLATTKTHRGRLALYMVQAGALGATDEEMQGALRMNPSTQRPRRGELVRMGVLRDSTKRRKTSSGSLAIVWCWCDAKAGQVILDAHMAQLAEEYRDAPA